jgi:hypothetical protein
LTGVVTHGNLDRERRGVVVVFHDVFAKIDLGGEFERHGPTPKYRQLDRDGVVV